MQEVIILSEDIVYRFIIGGGFIVVPPLYIQRSEDFYIVNTKGIISTTFTLRSNAVKIKIPVSRVKMIIIEKWRSEKIMDKIGERGGL